MFFIDFFFAQLFSNFVTKIHHFLIYSSRSKIKFTLKTTVAFLRNCKFLRTAGIEM